MNQVTVTSRHNLQNEVRYGEDQILITDEPISVGGDGAGPDPYTLLLGALGSCISMTVTLYARRKQWPLEGVTVKLSQGRIHERDCVECANKGEGFIHRIEHSVSFAGELTAEQRARLREIASKCPVHRTLASPIVIVEQDDGVEAPITVSS
jgi:putative redox protein